MIKTAFSMLAPQFINGSERPLRRWNRAGLRRSLTLASKGVICRLYP